MQHEKEWAAAKPTAEEIAREKTLKSVDTAQVMFPASQIEYAGTGVVEETIKSTEDVVKEMRTWLKTGIAPDGTRMMTDEASQWYQDFYQVTAASDKEHECLPEGSLVDYSYWTTPFLAHAGNVNLVMMHSQVNLRDGTHLPCDRLREKTKTMKNLDLMAQKRLEVTLRGQADFLNEAMDPGAHRGHPLRKEGLYTRYLWRPLHDKATPEATKQPERIPTVIAQAHGDAPPSPRPVPQQ